jgi:hypothetical protein
MKNSNFEIINPNGLALSARPNWISIPNPALSHFEFLISNFEF